MLTVVKKNQLHQREILVLELLCSLSFIPVGLCWWMDLEGWLSGNTLGFARFIVPRSSRNALNLIRFPINFDKCHLVCLQIVNHRYLTLRFISLRKGLVFLRRKVRRTFICLISRHKVMVKVLRSVRGHFLTLTLRSACIYCSSGHISPTSFINICCKIKLIFSLFYVTDPPAATPSSPTGNDDLFVTLRMRVTSIYWAWNDNALVYSMC